MPPSAEELAELEELKALIKGTPERPSTIPYGAVSRFMVGEENRAKADAARKEKEELKALKAEVAATQAAYAAKVKQQAQERMEAERAAKAANIKSRQDAAAQLRQREAKWKAEAEKKRQMEWDVAQKRVQAENEQWKRCAQPGSTGHRRRAPPHTALHVASARPASVTPC